MSRGHTQANADERGQGRAADLSVIRKIKESKIPRGLPQVVKDNIEKCQMTALAAVEAYNRPGKRFHTAQYLIMIIIEWTALFHAMFFRKNIKPWYKAKNGRYDRITS